jgi:Cof subfamily protein (haloacid dehalogenase superfamily)
MEYKGIFIDVDGTLLADNLEITEGTKDILKRLYRANLLISIVTARSPQASLPFYNDLEIANSPIICYNGALVICDNSILFEEVIRTKVCKILLAEAVSFNVSSSLYHRYDWFTERPDHWIKQEMAITKTTITQAKLIKLLEDGFAPNKILFMGEPGEISCMEDHLSKISFPDLNIFKSKPSYLEVINKNASKAQGIKSLINHYNIHESEIIAIGDNFNDIEMLKLAGTGVAMGNAPDEVKRIADMVTDSNNRDGIKKALELILKKNNQNMPD